MIMSKIIRTIKNPYRIFSSIGIRGWLNYIPDKTYLKIVYRGLMGEKLCLETPQKFNEKLQWLKLFDRNPEHTKLVDKYEVREYIAQVIGDEYLIPILGVYDNFDEINFNELPDQFVLKCTHDSGGIVICKDKLKINIEEVRNKMNRYLKRNYYQLWREWPYKNIKPKIICEKYMVDESGTELKDYKFMCFNGKAKCLFVCSNRNTPSGLNVNIYDMDWNPMPFERRYPRSNKILPKPKNFDLMVELAEKLSRNITFVRVDFYDIHDKVYFGELTLYPGSGFEEFIPKSYDYLLGSWLELPKDKNAHTIIKTS